MQSDQHFRNPIHIEPWSKRKVWVLYCKSFGCDTQEDGAVEGALMASWQTSPRSSGHFVTWIIHLLYTMNNLKGNFVQL